MPMGIQIEMADTAAYTKTHTQFITYQKNDHQQFHVGSCKYVPYPNQTDTS